MKEQYVYLYKISFIKENNPTLYYFGIRYGCRCKPEDDDYMGSPHTFKNLWEDVTYKKEKEIIESKKVKSRSDIKLFIDKESKLIKEAWSKHGRYGKGGTCLNMTNGKMFFITDEVRREIARQTSERMTGSPDHQMKRPEVKAKQAKSMSKFLLENPERNPNNLPEVREKHRKRLLENNPMHRPEIRAKVSGINNPMYGKKHTEETKNKISQSLKVSMDDDYRKQQSITSKKNWSNPNFRKKVVESHKKRWAKIRKEKQSSQLPLEE